MQLIRRHALARIPGILACVLALCATSVPVARAATVTPPRALRVTVDPGHGGAYTGAYYGGVTEKALNLAIARKVVAQLRARGIDARLTRDTDAKVGDGSRVATWRWDSATDAYEYRRWPVEDAGDRLALDLQSRCDVANQHGSDLFVSIHCNAGGSSARGIEVWRAGNDPAGAAFAGDVLSALLGTTGAANRGVQEANFYVTRWSNMPAILVECGFMSNSTELGRLRSSWYQTLIAKGIANGIARYAQRGVEERYTRIAGSDRFATAAAISQASYPSTGTVAVLASSDRFSDALVAVPLARQLRAPILLARASVLPPATQAELTRLKPDRIVVLGGTGALSAPVVQAAATAAGTAPKIDRIDVDDRYGLSLQVARRVASSETSGVVIASGEVFADAMSIAASAAERAQPIILASPSGLTDDALGYVRSLPDTWTVTVIGGPVALPESAMRGLDFSRVAGSDRYETNWQVIRTRYGTDAITRAYLVSGETYPDALTVGPLAASTHSPIVLVGRTRVAGALRPWRYSHRTETLRQTVVGGSAAVSAYVGVAHEKWRMNRY